MEQSMQTQNSGKQAGDVFDVFGHGIKSYFFMMEEFIKAFCILTVMFCIIIAIYTSGQVELKKISIGLTTLGNLNQPEFICNHRFISIENKPFELKCSKGTINQLKYFGMIP